jgi:hypothetical protein
MFQLKCMELNAAKHFADIAVANGWLENTWSRKHRRRGVTQWSRKLLLFNVSDHMRLSCGVAANFMYGLVHCSHHKFHVCLIYCTAAAAFVLQAWASWRTRWAVGWRCLCGYAEAWPGVACGYAPGLVLRCLCGYALSLVWQAQMTTASMRMNYKCKSSI